MPKKLKEAEVDDWFSMNAPRKRVQKLQSTSYTDTSEITSQSIRPDTPLATLDQIPVTYSPHYHPKPSMTSNFSKKKKNTQRKKCDDDVCSHESDESSVGSKGTYTIESDKYELPENEGMGDEKSTAKKSKNGIKSVASIQSSTSSSSSSSVSAEKSARLPDLKEKSDSKDIRSSFVSEWIQQHQKIPSDLYITSGSKPPSYSKCLSESVKTEGSRKASSLKSSDEHGKKPRRSLPQIPVTEIILQSGGKGDDDSWNEVINSSPLDKTQQDDQNREPSEENKDETVYAKEMSSKEVLKQRLKMKKEKDDVKLDSSSSKDLDSSSSSTSGNSHVEHQRKLSKRKGNDKKEMSSEEVLKQRLKMKKEKRDKKTDDVKLDSSSSKDLDSSSSSTSSNSHVQHQRKLSKRKGNDKKEMSSEEVLKQRLKMKKEKRDKKTDDIKSDSSSSSSSSSSSNSNSHLEHQQKLSKRKGNDTKEMSSKEILKQRLKMKEEKRDKKTDDVKSDSSSSKDLDSSSSSTSSDSHLEHQQKPSKRKKNKKNTKKEQPKASIKSEVTHSGASHLKSSTNAPVTSISSQNKSSRSRLSRSGSFTKDKPSGVVPFDQLPVIENPIENKLLTKEAKMKSIELGNITTNTSDTESDLARISSSYERSMTNIEMDGNIKQALKSTQKGRNPSKKSVLVSGNRTDNVERQSTNIKYEKNMKQSGIFGTLPKSTHLEKSTEELSDARTRFTKNIPKKDERNSTTISSPSGMRLNRATLLRKNKAKQMINVKPRLSPNEPRKNGRNSPDVLSNSTLRTRPQSQKLSKPPNRLKLHRLVDNTETDSISSNVYTPDYTTTSSSLETSPFASHKNVKSRRESNETLDITSSYDTTCLSSVSSSICTDVSLGAKIAHLANVGLETKLGFLTTSKKLNDQYQSDLTQYSVASGEAYDKQRHSDRVLGEKYIPCLHTDCPICPENKDSASAFQLPNQFLKREHGGVSSSMCTSSSNDTSYGIDTTNYGHRQCQISRSPPDGEISANVTKVPHDLANDLEILSKSVDNTDISSLSEARSEISHAKRRNERILIDSLDSTQTVTVSSDSNVQSFIKQEKKYNQAQYKICCESTSNTSANSNRRTWIIDNEPLDGLALSNAVFLSKKLGNMALSVQRKARTVLKNPHDKLCSCQPCLESTSESKFSSNSSDVPLIQQTSTQEMASLINNLRHLECVLKEIEWQLDSRKPNQEANDQY